MVPGVCRDPNGESLEVVIQQMGGGPTGEALASVAPMVTTKHPLQGPSSVLPVPLRAAKLMSCQCLQGHMCVCWKRPTAAGGCADLVAALVFSQLQYCSQTGWAQSLAGHGSTLGQMVGRTERERPETSPSAPRPRPFPLLCLPDHH